MSEFFETDDRRTVLKNKLRQYFDGKIVRKDLTKKIKEGANVPVYVLDMNDEKQNALYTELDAALLKYEKTTQQQTAQIDELFFHLEPRYCHAMPGKPGPRPHSRRVGVSYPVPRKKATTKL